jgi:hypothetical protein
VDPAFDAELPGLYLKSLTVQPDGKILIATGYYFCSAGFYSARLIRLRETLNKGAF